MIAVIFEVELRQGLQDDYFVEAARLKAHLQEIDGFISIERFQSLAQPNKLLSLSFWRDEAAVKTWRELEVHRNAQHKGRKSIFDDYRLRVANVIRDYGMNERDEAPNDSATFHS